MSDQREAAIAPPWIIALGLLGFAVVVSSPAEAGSSRGTLNVRVQVVHPCDVRAAVSPDRIACGYRQGRNFDPDNGRSRGKRGLAMAIKNDRVKGLRTIVF
ncbi:MAG: hypothetical protein AAFY56_03650 [Pseudomonadota bacterium]